MINQKSAIVIATVLVFATVATTNVQAKTWFDVGWEDGRDDARNGENNNECPSELDNNDTGCALYRSGYSTGHAVRGVLHPEDSNN